MYNLKIASIGLFVQPLNIQIASGFAVLFEAKTVPFSAHITYIYNRLVLSLLFDFDKISDKNKSNKPAKQNDNCFEHNVT